MPTLWHTSGRLAVQILLELLMICTHTICNPMYLGVIEMSSMDIQVAYFMGFPRIHEAYLTNI